LPNDVKSLIAENILSNITYPIDLVSPYDTILLNFLHRKINSKINVREKAAELIGENALYKRFYYDSYR
jgi:hypothetical protein